LHLCTHSGWIWAHGQFINDAGEKSESHADGDVFLINSVAVDLLIYECRERNWRAGRMSGGAVGHPYREMIFVSQFDLDEIGERVPAVQRHRARAGLAYREANLVKVGIGHASAARDRHADKACGADVRWCRGKRQADRRHMPGPLAGRACGSRLD
jgi:hypothetical protein